MTGRAVHSGHMHTYGYLLTNLRTPFGFKRTRWTSSTIGLGLGLGGADAPARTRATARSSPTSR